MPFHKSHHSQRGSALLLLAIVMSVMVASMLLSRMNFRDVNANKEARDANVLAQAKAGLVAWAGNHEYMGTNVRSGAFPVPDTDWPSDGLQNTGQITIGRLPWKTLGLPELTDSSGETLWYAVRADFLYDAINVATAPPVSCSGASLSPTPKPLKAYSFDGTEWSISSPSDNCIIAVIFAVGAPLSGQLRPNADAKNYLEGVPKFGAALADFKNFDGAGAFLQGVQRDTQGNVILNDRMILVTWKDLTLPPTPTPTPSSTPVVTPTPPVGTPTPTPSVTATPSVTPTASVTPTPKPTAPPNTGSCPSWQPNTFYSKNTNVTYWNGAAWQSYKCHTAHTSSSIPPDTAPESGFWNAVGSGVCK